MSPCQHDMCQTHGLTIGSPKHPHWKSNDSNVVRIPECAFPVIISVCELCTVHLQSHVNCSLASVCQTDNQAVMEWNPFISAARFGCVSVGWLKVWNVQSWPQQLCLYEFVQLQLQFQDTFFFGVHSTCPTPWPPLASCLHSVGMLDVFFMDTC